MRKIIFALLPLLIECTNVQNKGNDSANTADGQLVTFHLNAPPSTVEPLLLSELADSVSYVALETTKETLTDMAIQCGDRYYTIINEERLLCFDKSGKYLHQIGTKGNGPEEYPSMSSYRSFIADPVTNWVYCNSREQTQVYDENGKYVKSIKREKSLDLLPNFVFNDLAYYAPTYTYHPTIEIIDERNNESVTNNKELIEKNRTFWTELNNKYGRKDAFGLGSKLIFSSSNDALFCWSVFPDTVIMAKGKEIKPFCRIIPENKYKPEDLYDENGKTFLLQPLICYMHVCEDKILLYVAYYISIDDIRAFNRQNEMKCWYWVVCDLKNGSVTYHPYYIINDLDGGPNVLIGYNFNNNLSVEDLKNDEEIYKSYFTEGVKAQLKDQDGKFQRLLESLADDANPIIRTIHWKK